MLNLVMLSYTSVSGVGAQRGLEDIMSQQYFVSTQGRVYAEYLAAKSAVDYPPFLLDLASQVAHGDISRAETLGQLAFRDAQFLSQSSQVTFSGDQVAFGWWRKHLTDVRLFQSSHPSFTLGLNSEDTGLGKWVTYIFVHSGFLHFIGNMIFLMIFGAVLERQIGGLGLLVVFVLSGVFAAGVFAVMTGVTSSPLVGSSGAVSGVMALFCILNWRRSVRFFFFFFLPVRGFMGFVFLPTWVAMILWVLGDLTGYLGTLPEIGGVAHTAHLGGDVAGLITGVVIYGVRYVQGRGWPGADGDSSEALGLGLGNSQPVGTFVPFIPPRKAG